MASNFSPWGLVSSGIGAGFQYAGSKKQAQATEDALNFVKSQKAKQEAAAQPYQNLGGMAVGQLPGIAARPPAGSAPAPYMTQPGAQTPRPMQAAPMNAMGAPAAATGAQAGPMVTLKAPDGSTRQFAQGDPKIQQALGMGAVQV